MIKIVTLRRRLLFWLQRKAMHAANRLNGLAAWCYMEALEKP